MTIAQIVYDNELHFGYSHEEVHEKVPSFPHPRVPCAVPDAPSGMRTRRRDALLCPSRTRSQSSTDHHAILQLMRIWSVMDDCIRTGVSSADEKLPGRLGLRRRAPMLYRRLMRGYILLQVLFRGDY